MHHSSLPEWLDIADAARAMRDMIHSRTRPIVAAVRAMRIDLHALPANLSEYGFDAHDATPYVELGPREAEAARRKILWAHLYLGRFARASGRPLPSSWVKHVIERNGNLTWPCTPRGVPQGAAIAAAILLGFRVRRMPGSVQASLYIAIDDLQQGRVSTEGGLDVCAQEVTYIIRRMHPEDRHIEPRVSSEVRRRNSSFVELRPATWRQVYKRARALVEEGVRRMTDAEQAQQFLRVLAGDLPQDERLIMTAFRGDPGVVNTNAWRPIPYHPDADLNGDDSQRRRIGFDENAYSSVASMRLAADGTWRRKSENFAAGLALMVDDVGTKCPPSALGQATDPTAIVETSPNNFQVWYRLDEPMRDAARVRALIDSFVEAKLLGDDPGMKGITRVGRIPGFVNAKAKYGPEPFRVRLVHFEPERRWSPEELVRALGIRPRPPREPMRRPLPSREEYADRCAHWKRVYGRLHELGMLKRDEPNAGGFIEMTCPWVGDHTGQADNGAAIAVPSEHNEWTGGWRCHHGGCVDKGWRHLTDWLDELIAEEMEKTDREWIARAA